MMQISGPQTPPPFFDEVNFGCSIFYPQHKVGRRIICLNAHAERVLPCRYPMCHRVTHCRKPAVRKGKPDVISARTPLLPSERAALCESCLTTGRLAEDSGAALADDDGLGVGEDGGDGEAAGALHVHEEGAGGGHKGLFCPVSAVAGVGQEAKNVVGAFVCLFAIVP